MTRDDITRMAQESGVWDTIGFPKEIERFADLVAAAEREACARVCDLAVRANSYQGSYQTVSDCAAVIRARGETK